MGHMGLWDFGIIGFNYLGWAKYGQNSNIVLKHLKKI
jgi:hypothetical protein